MIRKDIEKQKTMSILQAPGKENRPPKLNIKNEVTEAKRSSVPRVETKLKPGLKNSHRCLNKNVRNKKTNSSKLYSKNGNNIYDGNSS